jgi:hypothetical protein
VTPPLGTYSFLPWLRQGIAGRVTAADLDPAVRLRASVRVELELEGEPIDEGPALRAPVGRDVELFGPGDIVGIDARAIVRTEPRDWITNHEPNHLAHVEFYDEDFPWRYTPAAADATGLRLRPWIMLLVLEEGAEFEEVASLDGGRLPSIRVTEPAALPAADQLWAWAHVHVNRSLAGSEAEFVSTDMAAVLPRLQAVLSENPDLAYSRIVCPRYLEENRPYHAFVVPTFESGRLAGLGLDPGGAPHATFSAHEDYPGKPDPAALPVYHRWYFRTGSQGDFEYLVRLLQPRPVDSRVGVREIDVQDPDPGVPGIDDPDLGGVLKLGGALRVPRESLDEDELAEAERYENWDDPYPHPFQEALASLINVADDYATTPAEDANSATGLVGVAGDPDPIVTAPLYARWHALTRRLLRDAEGDPVSPDDNWVHELNLDPRHRVAAGFGTDVVQRHQEDYMEAAWRQVGAVLEANRRIRAAQLAKQVSSRWYTHHLLPLIAADPERALAITAPVHARVLLGDATAAHVRRTSRLAPATTSVAMRRATRPRSRLMRGLAFDDRASPRTLLARINDGEVSAAPPKVAPPGVATVDQVADLLAPRVPRGRWDWLLGVLARLLEALAGLLIALAATIRRRWGQRWTARASAALLERWARWLRGRAARARARGPAVVREANLTPEAVDALPRSPDFVLTTPGSGFTPTQGTRDSLDAVRFKDALRDWHEHVTAAALAGAVPAPVRLDLGAFTEAVAISVDPEVTIPRRARHAIEIPDRIADALIGEELEEVMAYPVIDLPMYEPLREASADRFVPNLDLIPANSITLLETNQPFIEAYMVGINHEFVRELLWRGFPSDNLAAAFRQFWDVRGFLDTAGGTEEQRRERLRDIPELHRWAPDSRLGDHDHREASGTGGEEAVLVMRGELLKKYPTAVIYARHAAWQPLGGTPDPARERVLEPLTAAEEETPPRTKVRTPLYEAKVDPDIYFFGFDLSIEEAKGEPAPADPGWFFVIEERPGEPRFGFDVERDPADPIQTFNDLAWRPDALPGGGPGDLLQAGALATLTLAPLGPDDAEKAPQRADDVLVAPAAASSARWAYVLYQAPVMVAVHAQEML